MNDFLESDWTGRIAKKGCALMMVCDWDSVTVGAGSEQMWEWACNKIEQNGFGRMNLS